MCYSFVCSFFLLVLLVASFWGSTTKSINKCLPRDPLSRLMFAFVFQRSGSQAKVAFIQEHAQHPLYFFS